ncbi:hypothetical protein C8Q74DRAFT_330635 [Fomes fomentarius]|nr:hypothetical protein C8Q74DRAFT_330635 [Fomes fomentarius]
MSVGCVTIGFILALGGPYPTWYREWIVRYTISSHRSSLTEWRLQIISQFRRLSASKANSPTPIGLQIIILVTTLRRFDFKSQ